MIFLVENNKYMIFYFIDYLIFYLVFVFKKFIDVINLLYVYMDFFYKLEYVIKSIIKFLKEIWMNNK